VAILMRARTRVLAGLACTALAAFLAGCGTTTTAASSSVLAKGTTLYVYLSVPPGAAGDPATQDILDAEQLACKQQRAEVTKFTVRCVQVAEHELSDNARTAIANTGAIAYIGDLQPGSSEQSAGIINALDVLQVSPTDTALELTQGTPAVSGAPGVFYEDWDTFGRTFARVVPDAAQEAQAQVAEMRSLHVRSLYVGDDGSDYGAAIAQAVKQGAGVAPGSITISGGESGAGAIFYGSDSPQAAAKFFDGAPAGAKLFGPSALDTPSFTAALSGSVHNLYISSPGFLNSDLPPAGRTFESQFAAAYGHQPTPQAIFGYEAVAAVLGVVQQAGAGANNRATVVRDFFKLKDRASALGSYSIDKRGDTSLSAFVLSRLRAGTLVPFKSLP
jgi:branched-chain amino acid transport system substrate-binding protein